jgi:kelch-like protein 36
MKESRENFVELKGFNTHIGIEAIINFIYTSHLQINFDNIIYILDAASHLQVNDAIDLCTSYLLTNLTRSNCANILKIADRFALNKVNVCTNEFITKNFVDVFVNGGDQFTQFTCEQLTTQLDNDCLQVRLF